MNFKSVFLAMIFIMVMSFGYNKVTLASEQNLTNTKSNAKVDNINVNTQRKQKLAAAVDIQGNEVIHIPLLGNMSQIAKDATEIVANNKVKTRTLAF